MWPPLGRLVFDDILLLNDPNRGIGSGFTGRVGLWKAGLEGFWEKPIFGHGFRAQQAYSGSHSGYIKLFVETGFVGGMLMLGAVLVETVRRYRLASRFRDLPDSAAPGINVVETMRLNAVVFSTLIMVLAVWVYEQLYINLGSIVSLVFWLMMAAPTYIDVQGNPRR
jgi:O-antigen ligase